ncbi:xylose isomerase [Streptomyces abyssalis]|uniref:Xylose isomerase n=1 Tax=Streptomyces abyssalis TaxID=933944 RepID=A0A1E7JSB9_9ACTN|nr:metabolite traffic protein EboE [Streptomyces abyssalis]OEU91756.1 xylose isomerase [Streptomyces abyssalis]OEU94106.1 xylose isomerase [Streptomyces abyssalis]
MRFRHPDGSTVHLAYCTNVHAAEDLDGVTDQLREYAEPVRRRLHRDRLGIGLWLARGAVRTLTADPAAVRALRGELDRRGLEVVTLNGFPYQGFGDEQVKYRVYSPDWTEPERLEHTTDLARLLTSLLPDDVTEGSVSTLPLAWRTGFTPQRRRTALAALGTLAGRLDALEEMTGRSIRIGLEPEPGCTVETTADALEVLTGADAPPAHRIGVCVDTCHLAAQFEEPEAAVGALEAAGISVVKSQLSAALHLEHPGADGALSALAEFDEPRFLHQTRAVAAQGVLSTDDLGEALEAGVLPAAAPWRAHFHVPLHAPPAPPLTSTLGVLRAALTRLVGGPSPLTRHLEVETYTWQALPHALRPRTRSQLADGIAAELDVAREMLTDLGLKELP